VSKRDFAVVTDFEKSRISKKNKESLAQDLSNELAASSVAYFNQKF
jgi:hypothetical protein